MKIPIRIFAFIVISLTIIISALYISLKHGFNIADLSLSNLHLRNASLIWEEKLKLSVERITVETTKDKTTENSTAGSQRVHVRDALQVVNVIEKWFTFIDIKQIIAGPLTARFEYREDENGQLTIDSPKLTVKSRISAEGAFLIVDIEQISSPEYKSHANGQLRFDAQQRTMTATLDGIVADTLPLHVEIKADRKELSFSGQGKQSVTDITPIVELFNLGPVINPWIIDYLSAGEISLAAISGSIPYKNPASILQTLHAVAFVKETEYTFAQGLEPVKAAETEVEFIGGVLKIKPHDALFYGQDAGSSELDINFNKSPFILTAHIKTQAQASGGILTLLEHYGIPFPFIQKTGLTDTDLTLAIDLSTVDIQSRGTFKTENAQFEYDGHLVDVDKLEVALNNTNLTLKQIDISQKGTISARITGQLDAAKSTGDLHASIDSLLYKSKDAELLLANPDKAPLQVDYFMRPAGDSISVSASTWQAGNQQFSIGGFSSPFSHDTWSGVLPATPVSIAPWLKSRVSGTFSRQSPYAELKIELLDLTHNQWRLNQPKVNLELILADNIQLKTKKAVNIASGDTKISLMPAHISYQSQKLRIHESGVNLSGQSFPGITGVLDFSNNTGELTLDQLSLVDSSDRAILVTEKPLTVALSLQENNTHASVPALGMTFQQHHQSGWSVALSDLGKLHKYSPLMQRYKLEKGEFTLISKSGSLPWDFNGKATLPSALLIDGNTPVPDNLFNGIYDGKDISISINEKVHVKLADEIHIDSESIGFNLPALISMNQQTNAEMENHASKSTANKPKKKASKQSGNKPVKKRTQDHAEIPINVTAKNSFIYLNATSRIPADEINVSIDRGSMDSELKFSNGSATMEIRDNKVSLAGKGFGPAFMNKLLSFTTLKSGQLEFQVSGGFDDLNAVVLIKDAVISDYGLASNVLAFINTVPSLLTFRIPHFNTDGLHAHEIAAGVNIQGGVVTLKSFHLDSNEIDVRGVGTANMNDETIDITLNLITGTKKSLGRIPLLGYVLSGDKKKPSITITVKGNMQHPDIKHTAFREVAVYPFELLKRTVILPGHLVKKVGISTGDSGRNNGIKDKE